MADFEDAATGPNHPVTGTTVGHSNVWHHAAATYDGDGTWNLYLDGVLDKTLAVGAASAASPTSIQHAALGTAMTSTGARRRASSQGVVDEARIWNVVRSAAQIAGQPGPSSSPRGTGLIGRWGLNEGTGTTAATTPSAAASTAPLVGAAHLGRRASSRRPRNSAPDAPTLNAPGERR